MTWEWVKENLTTEEINNIYFEPKTIKDLSPQTWQKSETKVIKYIVYLGHVSTENVS